VLPPNKRPYKGEKGSCKPPVGFPIPNKDKEACESMCDRFEDKCTGFDVVGVPGDTTCNLYLAKVELDATATDKVCYVK